MKYVQFCLVMTIIASLMTFTESKEMGWVVLGSGIFLSSLIGLVLLFMHVLHEPEVIASAQKAKPSSASASSLRVGVQKPMSTAYFKAWTKIKRQGEWNEFKKKRGIS